MSRNKQTSVRFDGVLYAWLEQEAHRTKGKKSIPDIMHDILNAHRERVDAQRKRKASKLQ